MTAINAGGPPPVTSVPAVPGAPGAPAGPGGPGWSGPGWPPPPLDMGVPRFLGRDGEFFGLLLRGALLLMVTLGLYRFWLTNDIRRYLWGHVEVNGDGLEYTGTARELLIGFLMAIVLLLPIYLLFYVAALMPDLIPYIGAVSFIVLALLGQFAVFRARRYRLTRTVYRGVRFFQTGSAVRYSLLSNFWSLVIVLTVGLAYPFAAASLERYKMRHTYYGDLGGQFVGSGWGLFARGILLWILAVAPLAAAVVFTVISVDWLPVLQTLLSLDIAKISALDENDALALAVGFVLMAAGWGAFAGLIFYPMFRAIVLRWWISGLRMGGVSAHSYFRNGQAYGIYFRLLGYAMLFGIAASVVGLLLAGLHNVSVRDLKLSSEAGEISGIVLGLIGYVAMMLGYSTIFHTIVTFRFWRLSFEMTQLWGLSALDGVVARGEASSALGEGLADALDVGGL